MNKNPSTTTDQEALDTAYQAESIARRMFFEAMARAAAGDAFAIEGLPEFRKAWLTAYFTKQRLFGTR